MSGYLPPKPDPGSNSPDALYQHGREVAAAVRNAFQGKINVTLDVTLTPNSATTVITDPRIAFSSHADWMPMTANASAAKAAGMWVSAQDSTTLTLTHANTATTDRTFRLLIIG